MTGTIHKYFTCANSSQGFVNYFPSTLDQMEKIYILKGGPGTGKSTLMKKIGNHFLSRGQNVEHIYCSSDAASLDGVVLCGSKTAVVDGTAPHIIEPQAPGAAEEYVNLGIAWDSGALAVHKDEILSLKAQISGRYGRIYRLLREAKEVHDQWETVYIDNTDFEKLDLAAEDLAEEILRGVVPNPRAPRSVHRFFGSLTPDGSVNHIENLTEGFKTRYFIKGRPGTGKSTLMKKVAFAAQNAGLDTEIYHCSFDPDSLDMVILRSLGICVFDSTPPHELFPSRDSDVILDLYETAVRHGTDEENQAALSMYEEEYASRIQKVQRLLGEIHAIHDDLEAIYIKAVDFSVINQITQDLIQEIEERQTAADAG